MSLNRSEGGGLILILPHGNSPMLGYGTKPPDTGKQAAVSKTSQAVAMPVHKLKFLA